MSTVSIRTARRGDLPGVVGLLADDPLGSTREQFEDPLPDFYIDAYDRMQEYHGNSLIVAVTEDGTVQGCLQLTITPGITRKGMLRATIEGVRIAKALRGSGLGSKLIGHAISEARAAGCGLVQLTTDNTRIDAQEFYKGLGFTPGHVGMKLLL